MPPSIEGVAVELRHRQHQRALHHVVQQGLRAGLAQALDQLAG